MTEQTPKLDVQTLEYVLSHVNKWRDIYDRSAYLNDEVDEHFEGRKLAMVALRNDLEILIREQQEVAA